MFGCWQIAPSTLCCALRGNNGHLRGVHQLNHLHSNSCKHHYRQDNIPHLHSWLHFQVVCQLPVPPEGQQQILPACTTILVNIKASQQFPEPGQCWIHGVRLWQGGWIRNCHQVLHLQGQARSNSLNVQLGAAFILPVYLIAYREKEGDLTCGLATWNRCTHCCSLQQESIALLSVGLAKL
eukprot:GHUV01043470.1.p1 GENE.GHUV01043470.1~~GHUV01043470.1.p1  ORF type:complete len:181 (-),score=14.64 GHUV01043470.1:231-773(-)